MTLEEYAAQQAQQTRDAQQAQPLDASTARIAAEKYYSLLAEVQQIIEEHRNPATVLTLITGAMFGANSAESSAIAEMIEQDKHPGGRELSAAHRQQQRKILQRQQKTLEEQLKEVAAAMARLDADAQAALSEETAAAAQRSAMVEVLTFCAGIDARGTLLREIRELYQRHRENPAAMGLLYGSMVEITPQLDLLQSAEFDELKREILAAADGGHT